MLLCTTPLLRGLRVLPAVLRFLRTLCTVVPSLLALNSELRTPSS